MEELFLDFAELEVIKKLSGGAGWRFDFPVLHVGTKCITFSKSCTPFLGAAVRWFTTPEYVIGLPAKKGSSNAFAVCHNQIGNDGNANFIHAGLPKELEEKKLQVGYYKLCKYKDGFAFKRYEPITVD